jgi:hypothetical protein
MPERAGQEDWKTDKPIVALPEHRYRGGTMAGKKDYDATKRLPPKEPTQVTDKGLKIGLPKRSTALDALRRVGNTTER